MIELAAAAAVSFCTPGSGAAADPRTTALTFIRAWNRTDWPAMRRLVTTDATMKELDEVEVSMAHWLTAKESEFPVGSDNFDTLPNSVKVIGGTVVTRTPVPCLRPRGTESALGPCTHRADTIMTFSMADGCITSLAYVQGPPE